MSWLEIMAFIAAAATAVKAIRDALAGDPHVTRGEWARAEASRDEQARVAMRQCERLEGGMSEARINELHATVRLLRDEVAFLQLLHTTPRRGPMAQTPVAPPAARPAWQTPQFWTSAVTGIVTMLVVLGYVPAASSDIVVQTALNAVTHVVALVSAGISIWSLASLHVRPAAQDPAQPPAPPTPPESGSLTDSDLRV